MSQGRQIRRNEYMYGSAARNIDVTTAIHEQPTYEPLMSIDGAERERRRTGLSLVYVLFITASFLFLGYTLIQYITLHSELTESADKVAVYEQQLYNLTLANDDEYSKMVKSVDLDEIRSIAINELGMVYPSDEQIISYNREHSDYVRQVQDIED